MGPCKIAWNAFKDVKTFLGNYRSSYYIQFVNKLLIVYKTIKINMTEKTDFLLSHFFPEIYVQSVKKMVKGFTSTFLQWENGISNWNSSMLAEYCWTLQSDVQGITNNNQHQNTF